MAKVLKSKRLTAATRKPSAITPTDEYSPVEAWERFEHAVDAAVRMKPIHRSAPSAVKSKRAKRKPD